MPFGTIIQNSTSVANRGVTIMFMMAKKMVGAEQSAAVALTVMRS